MEELLEAMIVLAAWLISPLAWLSFPPSPVVFQSALFGYLFMAGFFPYFFGVSYIPR